MATSILSAITYSRQLAQTDSNGIDNTLGLALYNDARQEWTRDMLNKNMDAAQTQESYRDISTNSPNTYLWPDDMYALKTIEVNWGDTTQQNYIQAQPMDVANIQEKSFSWLRANQDQNTPLFDNRGDQFEIFPTPIVGNGQGIRIFYFLKPTDATNVGEAVPYPQLLDYRTLSCKMASMYYRTQNDTAMADTYEAQYQQRIGKIIRIVEPGTQQPISPTPLSLTGWSY
jgi:hypothetical protein